MNSRLLITICLFFFNKNLSQSLKDLNNKYMRFISTNGQTSAGQSENVDQIPFKNIKIKSKTISGFW